MSAPQKVLDLVEVFDRNVEDYQSAGFNEAMLRQQFVNPLFKCLGWDMDNEQGYAEAYKDVIHEAAIKIGGATKAPDYSFRIGGTPKFYLEAKKPAVHVKDDPAPAFQLRRYAWSARMPLSILTNFKEFAVYDCRVKPAQTDKASTARILYLRCPEFAEAWDDKIAGVFSREAVLKGSFDKFADAKKAKRGTAAVDAAFLDEIETWRDELAKNLALRNPDITSRELNFAVQITIDRLIFLRMCEDRGIEPYGQLKNLQNDAGVYENLRGLYRKADERYNSGLFHFHKEKDRDEGHDELTPRLQIDDRVLKSIFRGLYYPESPYEFSVLPVEILGQVYEQFLGKVIRLTASHQAKVEEKPEVKKAGGVYYTPSYIVDYIVRHTVGRLLEGKTPKEAARLTVLDPACGSGSFLLGAYWHLLEWHLKRYEEDGPAKHKKEMFQAAGGAWRLTTAEKKRILLNGIYGVDIDPQAVEVTKLSLLLKVLEGESQETIDTQLRLFHERALPDLASNIKCGNSLIGPEFYEGRQMDLFDEEERYRINVFDWNAAFPKIMKGGGFGAVIGNPPYLYSAGQDHPDYFQQRYELCQYQTDFYVYFVERALKLARLAGKVSFIVSDAWLKAENFSILRNHLLSKHRIDIVAVFDYPVFKRVALENSILIVSVSGQPTPFTICRFRAPEAPQIVNTIAPRDAIDRNIIDPRSSADAARVVARMEVDSGPLDEYVYLNRGIHAYRTDGYGASKFGTGAQTKRDKEEESYHADTALDDTYLPELKGKDVARFSFLPTGRYVSYGPWLAEPRKPEFFFKPKLALRKVLGPKLHGTLIEEPTALDQSLYVVISKHGDTKHLKYILGVMLSRLGAYYLRTKHAIYDTLYPWYTKKQLAQFPVKAMNDRLVQLVEQMLALHKQSAAAKAPHDRTVLQAQIDATDRQIDRLVYDLYGLTEEEIRIVEGGTAT